MGRRTRLDPAARDVPEHPNLPTGWIKAARQAGSAMAGSSSWRRWVAVALVVGVILVVLVPLVIIPLLVSVGLLG